MSQSKKKILLIHQGSELYGSDRSLLNLIDAVKHKYSIEVWLPDSGDLSVEIVRRGVRIVYKNLSILRFIDIKKGNFSVFKNIICNWKRFKNEGNQFDLILFNTVVCIDFLVPMKIPKVVYVREIKNGLISTIFSVFFYFSNSYLFFNSRATATNYFFRKKRGTVISNTIKDQFINKAPCAINYKNINLLFIGRIMERKGLSLLIDALRLFIDKNGKQSFTLNIAGDIYKDNDSYFLSLKKKVEQSGLQKAVNFIGFIKKPVNVLLDSDILIVPSIEPESFGRVAVEAMMLKKIVVVADHGGLSEIIDDEINGFKFKPKSSVSLMETLQKIASGNYDLNKISESARNKYLNNYHPMIYNERITKNIESVINHRDLIW